VRILILTQLFHPEPDLKGLPLARALRARGHEVEILTGFPHYPGGRLYPGYALRPWKTESVEGVRVRRVALYPSHDRNGFRRALTYLSFALSAAVGSLTVRRPDVIYVYNLITLMPAARLVRRFRGARIVLDVQDLWPESVASSGMMRQGASFRWLERWADDSYAAADHLVVLSPGFKQELVRRGVPADRIDVVYNWSSEFVDSGGTNELNDSGTNGSSDRFDILFAGTMGIMQDLDVVIEAARLLQDRAPDVRFTLVGSGVERDRLMRRAQDSPNVLFLPRRPASEMGELLASADALLVHLKDDPLFRVTIPSKIQAYLQAGKPILCGVHGDAADLVTRAGAGRTFAPGDPHDLCRAILALRDMTPGALREMGERGQRFYQGELALVHGVDRMEQVFSRIVGAPAGRYPQ
jgi:colanic acid biosynthesis glycosyl transferase WcaI